MTQAKLEESNYFLSNSFLIYLLNIIVWYLVALEKNHLLKEANNINGFMINVNGLRKILGQSNNLSFL